MYGGGFRSPMNLVGKDRTWLKPKILQPTDLPRSFYFTLFVRLLKIISNLEQTSSLFNLYQ
jgi:hypothetical protein